MRPCSSGLRSPSDGVPVVRPPEVLAIERIATPIGALLAVTDEAAALRALDFEEFKHRLKVRLERAGPMRLAPRAGASAQRAALEAYFAGELGAIDGLRVAPSGTPFQKRVWCALRGIEAGSVTSYGVLARRIGHPTAVRAVGAANGANPIGVVIPCHRVIGANGSLTGYGGGLARKRWLLRHEGAPAAGD
ncbi:MAG: methylated-DNA--[protein]-cysteine S-methyltransferase [Myxococcales bacterium]|nr:methylated-DNA--[protein]-cysteine S-methyltransferase [Myxococcales bacterium]